MTTNKYERGSEWRQWDLHVHTPASFHWKGQRFQPDLLCPENMALVDEMIEAFNKAEPAVYALMDYWTFDGWFALKHRLKQPGAPKLTKTVFPGIELRLMAPMDGRRLNAHVIFSDQIPDQHLRDFLATLVVERINRPLSPDALIALARNTAADKLEIDGFKKPEVAANDVIALHAGMVLAEINCDSYKRAIAQVPDDLAIGFMPYDTSDGLQDIKWEDHYSYFLGLFESSPIFESRNLELRYAFLCEETPKNKGWLENFKHGLKSVPRLVVSGSDAHTFVGTEGNNDKRGYGDFPSNKKTWIKADPTFRGLKQAILEPSKRSFIGVIPPKLEEVQQNKTFYIDTLEIRKNDDAPPTGDWLDGCDIPLNTDLIAIIGNKGSGKSALADVIAVLGNTKQTKHLSFLKKDRFWGKSGEPARHFSGTLSWLDASTVSRGLNELPAEDEAELVRYIPQGYFEELCNEHVSGKSNSFEGALRSVIFSHASEEIRLGALDFDQLTEQQEQSLRNRLGEYRKELNSLNAAIVRIEEQLLPIEVLKLTNLLALKLKQIEEHEKVKPQEVHAPSAALNDEQKQASDELDKTNSKLSAITTRLQTLSAQATNNARQLKAITNIRERVRLLKRTFDQAEAETAEDLALLGLSWREVVTINVTDSILEELSQNIATGQSEIKTESEKLSIEMGLLVSNQKLLGAKLDQPQQAFQAYQVALKLWQQRLDELAGSPTEPETRAGLQARIEQIKGLPSQLTQLQEQRLTLTGEIFEALSAQRKAREDLFKPVQDLIQRNRLIRDDYKLQFQASLSGSPDAIADSLFSYIKQTQGEFKGQDEAPATVRRLFEQFDLNTKEGALEFAKTLNQKIEEAAKSSDKNGVGIFASLKKDKSAVDVYDFVFGLGFLAPRYTLLFQDTQIEQLSPGQRGALLLIFYLLVDQGRLPIILDQPEENLDNETVFRLLVPVLTEAKKTRQIIMVTHNPNLAVVCDAEQIIQARFDRADNSRITYEAGAIENPLLNGKVVTVLEGTKPAFDNRSSKYHDDLHQAKT